MDGNNGRCLADGRKGMQRPGLIENVLEKILARAGKVLWHVIGNFVWASGSGRRRRSKRSSETSEETWLGGAWKSSLCYAGSNVGEKEEQVAFHTSALAKTDEVRREAKM